MRLSRIAKRASFWGPGSKPCSEEASIQFMSDLHLELLHDYLDFAIPVASPNLLLAGDIGRFSQLSDLRAFVQYQCSRFQKVFFIIGNHEPYGMTRDHCLTLAQDMEQSEDMKGRLVLMERRRFDLDNSVTILGCTLHSQIVNEAKEIVRMKVNDFRKIEDWSVDAHNLAHKKDLSWLKSQIEFIAANEPHRKIIIATHHAPSHVGTADPRHQANPWTSAFSTDLLGAIQGWTGSSQVRIWVFGHTHWSVDQQIGNMRLVSNQRGYVFPQQEVEQQYNSGRRFMVGFRKQGGSNNLSFNPERRIIMD